MKVAIATWCTLLATLVLCACTESHQEGFDKNTNWLRDCKDSNECGAGLQCVCGVCTSVCDRNAQCSDLADGAVCVGLAAMSDSCAAEDTAAAQRVCTLACKTGSACAERNDALTCMASACTLAVSSADGGDDAGADAAMAHGDHDAGSPGHDGGGDAISDAGGEAQVDAHIADPISAACTKDFTCDVAAMAPGNLKGIVAGADGSIYWTDWGTLDDLGNNRKDGAIRRVPKDGGPIEVMIDQLDRPWRLWSYADNLYWLSGTPGDFGVAPGMQTLYMINASGTEPVKLKTDPFLHVQMFQGVFTWQTAVTVDGTVPEPGISVQRWSSKADTYWTEQTIKGLDYVIDGIDGAAVYIEDGSQSIQRMGYSGTTSEILADPPAFLVTVGDEALWLIHTDAQDRDWVASMPKAGGSVTNVGSGDGYYDPPQPGKNLVWLVTGNMDKDGWQLWSIPKSGGERVAAFSWPTTSGHVRDDAPAPIWIADGDSAWVFGHGALVHVQPAQ
jgi:hypothetical protein